MLKIYHASNTRGMRVIWLCEELGLEYEVEKIDFSVEFRTTPEWRALSPTGKVPVMTDADMRMFESGAMVQYILYKYADGALVPAVSDPQYGQYLQWLWFAEATLSRPLGEIVNHGREFPGENRIEEVVQEMANRAIVCVAAVAQHMQNREFLINDTFCAADIMMGYSLYLADMLVPDSLIEDIQPYWQRLQARPGFKVAQQA